MTKIDAHHHFWRYDPLEYDWIDDDMKVIRRDFLPEELKTEIAAVGIEGVVSVQAQQTLEETRWLLKMADQHEFIRGVVGWVPLVSDKVKDELTVFAASPKLKAVRHVLQAEPDENYMLRPDFNEGVSSLHQFGLAYDILILERHLPQTIQFVDRHPGQAFVLDHIAKPRIREKLLSPWRENISELARRENVYCKLSGLVTEADYRCWIPEQIQPYMEIILEAFGPRRIMFGSDWPVCLVACGYRRWYEAVYEFAESLSTSERARIFGETAVEAYKLSLRGLALVES